ncbi:MAG TPA: hypothetical protein GX704_07190 [Clostridiales bacterium]|jgi:hypothetical protein|nr:hypothetical protein [Clostridiales bacterium]
MKKLVSIAVVMMMVLALGVSSFASTNVPDDDGNIFYDVPGCLAAPVLDGVINDGEYSLIETKPSQWSRAVSDDANDGLADEIAKTAKVYMCWDADYIYYASTFVAPNGFANIWADDPPSMWYSGAIQMEYCDTKSRDDDTTNRLEYGIGVTADGTKVTTVWANPEDFSDAYTAEMIPDNFAMKVDGNNVTFEVRTPWGAFQEAKGAVGVQCGITVVYSIGLEQDYVHAQLAAGCTGEGGKNVIHTALLTMKEAPPPPVVEEEPAPVEEAPAAAEAPPAAETVAAAPAAPAAAAQTGDVAAILVLAAVAAIGTAAVVSKKR